MPGLSINSAVLISRLLLLSVHVSLPKRKPSTTASHGLHLLISFWGYTDLRGLSFVLRNGNRQPLEHLRNTWLLVAWLCLVKFRPIVTVTVRRISLIVANVGAPTPGWGKTRYPPTD